MDLQPLPLWLRLALVPVAALLLGLLHLLFFFAIIFDSRKDSRCHLNKPR